MIDYYNKRAGEYEDIYRKPERQEDLASLKAYVRGNTYQLRRLKDGSEHRVMKNFPSDDALRSAVSGAADVVVKDFVYYWCLHYVPRRGEGGNQL